MSQPEETNKQAALAAATMMQHLSPGSLADLRRMTKRNGAPAFWRLAAQHLRTIGRQTEEWMDIIRILAILTPKGDPAVRSPLHDGRRQLGAVLCDGGDPEWSGPEPVYSERRLAQLMAARGPQRAVLLERAARVVARSRTSGSGVNVVDIAFVLLSPDHGRRLAEPYYHRLDRAERAANQAKEETPK
jgi:CRISPR system Cascade subunit CasB